MTTVASVSLGRPRPLRWTGEEFDRASESGLFQGRRVELIDGELLEMGPMNDPHAAGIRLATYALLRAFPPDQFTISPQCPMRLGEFRPFPDLVVVRGTARQIVTHPTTALLVVEISDTTLEYDRTEKSALYSAHMLPDYWIVNLNAKCVEVRRKPVRAGGLGAQYEDVRTFGAGEIIHPLGLPGVAVAVSDLLP